MLRRFYSPLNEKTELMNTIGPTSISDSDWLYDLGFRVDVSIRLKKFESPTTRT